MDAKLKELLFGPSADAEAEKKNPLVIRFVDDAAGEIEFKTKAVAGRYVLKPLPELYGEGLSVKSLSPHDQTFVPLLYSIESTIARYFRDRQEITDANVAMALNRMGSSPEIDPGEDALCRRIQMALRMELSLRDYSRQQVKHAIKRVAKSVQAHSRDGIRGYLGFIQRFA